MGYNYRTIKTIKSPFKANVKFFFFADRRVNYNFMWKNINITSHYTINYKIILQTCKEYGITGVSIILQKAEIKKKKLEHEDVGVQLYDTQQNVTKQQALIHSCHETVSKISKIRQEMETQVEAHKNTYECEQQKLRATQKKGYICHNVYRNLRTTHNTV